MLTHKNLERFLGHHGIAAELVEFSSSVVKSSEASKQAKDGVVVKSVVLKAGEEVVIAILRGADRVDLAKVSALLGKEVRLARAKEVKQEVGYDVGGVPPFAHLKRFLTLVDEKVEKLRDSVLYAGGGSHKHLLRLRGKVLLEALERVGVNFKVVNIT